MVNSRTKISMQTITRKYAKNCENNECYVDYFGPVSLPLFASDLNDAEEIRFLSTLMFHKHFFLFSFLFYLLEFSQ